MDNGIKKSIINELKALKEELNKQKNSKENRTNNSADYVLKTSFSNLTEKNEKTVQEKTR